MVTINLAIQAINPLITGVYSMGTLPEKFRPLKTLVFAGNAHYQGGSRFPISIEIYTDGNVKVNLGNENLSHTIDWIGCAGSYVV